MISTGCRTLDEARSPSEWIELLSQRGIVISERTLREKANRLGARHKIGRAMLITPAQMEFILGAEEGENARCHSNATSAARPGGSGAGSNTRAPRSHPTTAAALAHLTNKVQGRGSGKRKPGGSVVTFSGTKRA